jgi:hypothetical protein
MHYLAFVTKFTRTKNKNSRILNVGCKNISFQLPYAKKLKLQYLGLSEINMESRIYRLWCLGGTFFSVLTEVHSSRTHQNQFMKKILRAKLKKKIMIF